MNDSVQNLWNAGQERAGAAYAKALSGIASLAAPNDEEEIAAILSRIPDPPGTFYRYSLPVSMLQRRKI